MKGATLTTTLLVLVAISGPSLILVVDAQEPERQVPPAAAAVAPSPQGPPPAAATTVTPSPQPVTVTQRPAAGKPTTRAPLRRNRECTKQPPNFREINLPCGGYDRAGCQKLCQKLEYPRFYCRKEEFCLCHSGDLYSC